MSISVGLWWDCACIPVCCWVQCNSNISSCFPLLWIPFSGVMWPHQFFQHGWKNSPPVAPGPSRMFQITSVTTTNISFSWQAPAFLNGILVGYQLTCQPELPVGIPSPPILTPGPTMNANILSNLFPGVRYNCSIVARNSAGPSDPIYAVGTTTETGTTWHGSFCSNVFFSYEW